MFSFLLSHMCIRQWDISMTCLWFPVAQPLILTGTHSRCVASIQRNVAFSFFLLSLWSHMSWAPWDKTMACFPQTEPFIIANVLIIGVRPPFVLLIWPKTVVINLTLIKRFMLFTHALCFLGSFHADTQQSVQRHLVCAALIRRNISNYCIFISALISSFVLERFAQWHLINSSVTQTFNQVFNKGQRFHSSWTQHFHL